jgi:hypothetical protein
MVRSIKLFALFVSFVAASCETIIDVDVPLNNPKVTINGYLQPDSTVFVAITQSKSVLDTNLFMPIDDATIIISENGIEIERVDKVGSGWFMSSIVPKVGNYYNLRIETEKYGNVEAEAYVPQQIRIKDLKISDKKVFRNFEQFQLFEIQVDDPLESNNMYEVIILASFNESIFKNDTLIHNDMYHYYIDLLFEDASLDDQYSVNGTKSLLFLDEKLDSNKWIRILAKSKIINDLRQINEEFDSEGDTYRIIRNDVLSLVLKHTDKSYFNFKKSLNLHLKTRGNPFAEPVIVFSNVNNGHGIFAGYTAYKKELEIPLFENFN